MKRRLKRCQYSLFRPFGFGQGKNHFRGTLENKRCPTMEAPHNCRTSNRLE
jgi:hypothetical protein